MRKVNKVTLIFADCAPKFHHHFIDLTNRFDHKMLNQLRRDTMQSRIIENVNHYRKRKFCEETYQLQKSDNILEVLSHCLAKINDLATLVNEYLMFKEFPHLPVPELQKPIIMPLLSLKKFGVCRGHGYPMEIDLEAVFPKMRGYFRDLIVEGKITHHLPVFLREDSLSLLRIILGNIGEQFSSTRFVDTV